MADIHALAEKETGQGFKNKTLSCDVGETGRFRTRLLENYVQSMKYIFKSLHIYGNINLSFSTEPGRWIAIFARS